MQRWSRGWNMTLPSDWGSIPTHHHQLHGERRSTPASGPVRRVPAQYGFPVRGGARGCHCTGSTGADLQHRGTAQLPTSRPGQVKVRDRREKRHPGDADRLAWALGQCVAGRHPLPSCWRPHSCFVSRTYWADYRHGGPDVSRSKDGLYRLRRGGAKCLPAFRDGCPISFMTSSLMPSSGRTAGCTLW